MKKYWLTMFWLAISSTTYCQQLKGQRFVEIALTKIDGLRQTDKGGLSIGLNCGKVVGRLLSRQWEMSYLRKEYSIVNQSIPVETIAIGYAFNRTLFQNKGVSGFLTLGGVGGYQLINRGNAFLDNVSYQLTNRNRVIVGGETKLSFLLASTISIYAQTLWFPTSDVQKFHTLLGVSIRFY
jgi:hypothetical protein